MAAVHTVWLDQMLLDIRFALRTLRRNALFSLVALGSLTFGISATTTVSSMVDAVLLRPSTFTDAGSMVRIQGAPGKDEWANVPPAAFARLRSHSELFRQTALLRNGLFTVTGVPVPRQVFGA